MPFKNTLVPSERVRTSLRQIFLRVFLAIFVLQTLIFPTNAYADGETLRKAVIACAVAYASLGGGGRSKAQDVPPTAVVQQVAPPPVEVAKTNEAQAKAKADEAKAKEEAKLTEVLIPTDPEAFKGYSEAMRKQIEETDPEKRDAAVARAEEVPRRQRTAVNKANDGSEYGLKRWAKWVYSDPLAFKFLIGTSIGSLVILRGWHKTAAAKRKSGHKQLGKLLAIEEALRDTNDAFTDKRDELIDAFARLTEESRKVLLLKLDQLNPSLYGRIETLVREGLPREEGNPNRSIVGLSDELMDQYRRYYAKTTENGEAISTLIDTASDGRLRTPLRSPEEIEAEARTQVSELDRTFFVLKATTDSVAKSLAELDFVLETNLKKLGKPSPTEMEKIARLDWVKQPKEIAYVADLITRVSNQIFGTRTSQRVLRTISPTARVIERNRTDARLALSDAPPLHRNKVLVALATFEHRFNPLRSKNLGRTGMGFLKAALLGALAFGPATFIASTHDADEQEQEVLFLKDSERRRAQRALVEQAFWNLVYIETVDRLIVAWDASMMPDSNPPHALNVDYQLNLRRPEAGYPLDNLGEIKAWVTYALEDQKRKNPHDEVGNTEAYFVTLAEQLLKSYLTNVSGLEETDPELVSKIAKEVGHKAFHARDHAFTDTDQERAYFSALATRYRAILQVMKAEYEAIHGPESFVEPDMQELERLMGLPMPAAPPADTEAAPAEPGVVDPEAAPGAPAGEVIDVMPDPDADFEDFE